MFDEDRPIFLQLADRISDEILRGVYAEGEQVPSTNELAAHLRINPATAGKSLNLLVDREVLFKRRGLGMFVAEGARTRIAAARQDGLVTAYIDPLLDELLADLERIRERGYAIDDNEQEIGVRCFAVPVPNAPTPTAISVSGPTSRVDEAFGLRAVPLLQQIAANVGHELRTSGAR